MAGESILVVDDNATNAKLIFFLLKKRGYDVRCAASGEETLALLKEFRPALILMDIQMPGMDGFELSRRLKADPATRDIILIAVTAYAMKGDEQRVREAGCDGYLAKPIDTRALPGVIASYLARTPAP
ncbi:MAG: response regulator [Deltaproteobacteria bacterium]|nr:MAG: response regulator [Deltaproteobacteria bacterium]